LPAPKRRERARRRLRPLPSLASQASLAAYFAQLLHCLEAPSALGRYLQHGTAVQGGILCAYDAFGRVDVRCELAVPGGVTCYALDGVGEAVPAEELDEDAWRRVRVSAALRALRAHPAPLLRAACVRRLNAAAPLPSPADEAALLEDALALRGAQDAAAAACALAGRGPGVLPEGTRHWERSPPEDVLLNTLLRHFLRARRPAAAVAFLRRAADADADAVAAAPDAARPPPAAAPLAQALLAQGAHEEAAELLRAAIVTWPRDVSLRLVLVDALAAVPGGADAACDAARDAAATAPSVRAVWLRLASALAACGRFSDALTALNCAPYVGITEEESADAWRGYFPSGRPPPVARRTQPRQWAPADAAQEAELATWEDAALPGRDALRELSAAALLPPPEALPYATGFCPAGAPLQPAAAAAAGAYGVLVDVVTALGWEGFLAERGGVFVMDDGGPEEEEEEDEDEEADEDGRAGSDSGSVAEGEAHGKGADAAAPAALASASAGTAGAAPRAGTRDAGVRAPGAPPPGASPQSRARNAPASAEGKAAGGGGDDASVAAAVAPPTLHDAHVDGCAPVARARGEAEVSRDRAALASRGPLAPKRLCAEWLDVLIGALYEDVAEYAAWRTAEAADAAMARAAAGGGCSTPPAPAAASGAASQPLSSSEKGDEGGEASAADADAAAAAAAAEAASFEGVDTEAALGTAGDWLRRGALCERLKRADDAERAYRVAVHLGFHATAWRALGRIYAAWGWAPEALTAVAQLAAAAADTGGDAHGAVAATMRHLIAVVGLQAARTAQEALGPAHDAVNAAFHDAVRWKSEGWDA
jgi:tetratricopeptide (TPR) repeat protein